LCTRTTIKRLALRCLSFSPYAGKVGAGRKVQCGITVDGGEGMILSPLPNWRALPTGSSRHSASIVTEIDLPASRCNRTDEGPSWVPMYGPSRGAYADYRGSRRDCHAQPMLMSRELRSGALIAAVRVELERWYRDVSLLQFTSLSSTRAQTGPSSLPRRRPRRRA
jgi:hypothetical protein